MTEVRDMIEDPQESDRAMAMAMKLHRHHMVRCLHAELRRQQKVGYPSDLHPAETVHPFVGAVGPRLTPLSGGFDLGAIVDALQKAAHE